MRRIWLVVAVLLLAGCGVQPSGVTDGGAAPTGVAPGMTLYFVDSGERLRPQLRPAGHLGSIAEALSLLLAASGYAAGYADGLHTEIASAGTTQVVVSIVPGVIQLRVPLTTDDVTPLGIDQIVCTALGVEVQSGGPRDMTVRIQFTLPAPASDAPRTCPLISPAG